MLPPVAAIIATAVEVVSASAARDWVDPVLPIEATHNFNPVTLNGIAIVTHFRAVAVSVARSRAGSRARGHSDRCHHSKSYHPACDLLCYSVQFHLLILHLNLTLTHTNFILKSRANEGGERIWKKIEGIHSF